MVFTGMAFANGGLHETGERGKDINGWVDTFVVELTVNKDLAFGDVPREVGDGMCDI